MVVCVHRGKGVLSLVGLTWGIIYSLFEQLSVVDTRKKYIVSIPTMYFERNLMGAYTSLTVECCRHIHVSKVRIV